MRFLERTDLEGTERVYLAAAGGLSWTDAVVVHWCRVGRARPVCFDRAIERAVPPLDR